MDNNTKIGLDALDILSVLLAYISLHNYEENIEQNQKLDSIIYDIEKKLDYHNRLLNRVLERVEQINGK